MPPVAQAIQSAAFRELARQQDDVVSRQQLRQLKVTWQHIQSRIKAGSWQDIGPHVVVLLVED